jgi:DNA-binding LytR/AlgR family response regulator
MMKVLIIEDEAPAARRLQQLLESHDPTMLVISIIDSIEDAVQWLKDFPHPELIFMDIMLADGQSFEIFEQVEVRAPIIFTTAYDEYAIRAFKVNSIDYLLKPVEPLLLAQALNKYRFISQSPGNFREIMESLLLSQTKNTDARPAFKSRFLIRSGDKFISVETSEVAWFCFEEKLTFLYTVKQKRYMLDHTLDELEKLIDPFLFFRLNRQYITSFSAIRSVHNYFNGKLKVYLTPETENGIVVSKEKAHYLKLWLNR